MGTAPRFLGSGKGPLRRVDPPVRLITGLLLLAAVLTAPAGVPAGVWMIPAVALLTAAAAGLPPRHLVRVLGLAVLFYGPLVTLLELPTFAPILRELAAAVRSGDAGAASAVLPGGDHPALRRIGSILLRGVASLVVTVATISTIRPAELPRAIGGLPLPANVRLILLQIVQQTGMLLNESLRVRDAVALRAGGAGRSELALARSLPVAWLSRVAARADRVAAAMEVRGYVSAALPTVEAPHRRGRAEVVAISGGLALLTAALALRIYA